MSTPLFNHEALERFIILLGDSLFRTYSLGESVEREIERLKLLISDRHNELTPGDIQQLLRLTDIYEQFRRREIGIPDTRLDDIRATYLTNENDQDPRTRSI